MTKNLLSMMLILAGFLASSQLKATEVILTIIETHKDGDVSISNDDGEYENDSIDKLDDDDLDMGWEGEDLNIMTTFARFQNVQIEQGTKIDSAVFVIYAHEDEADEAIVTFYAEDIDNSPAFSEDEALNDRTHTSASVVWNITENWTMWQQYHSPNIASVIQEVINRSGWSKGNALTIFIQGQDQGASLLDNARDFESFENIEDPDDGGDGLHHPERIPVLKIYYGGPATIVNELNANTIFELYPNPVTNHGLNISLRENVLSEITLLDMSGKIVHSAITTTNISLNTAHLSKGIYLVKVQQNNSLYTQKVILN